MTAPAGIQPGQPAFDVEELLGAQVGGEPGLGHDIIRQLQRHAGGDGGVGSLRDVGERPAMHKGGRAFERLHQVRMNGVAEQHLHGAHRLDLRRPHRLALVGEGDHHLAQPFAQVAIIPRQAEDRHHFGRRRDVEPVAARHAVFDAAQPDDDVAQGAVVQVNHPAQDNLPGIDAQLVAVLEVIVHHGREQVVGLGHGVHVADEVQVDVLRRHHLRPSGAGAAAFDAEIGPQRRFPDAEDGPLAQVPQGVGQADRGGGLADPLGRGGHGADEHQVTVGLALAGGQLINRDLGDEMPVRENASPCPVAVPSRPPESGAAAAHY